MVDFEKEISIGKSIELQRDYARAYILNLAIPKTIEQVYSRATTGDPSEFGRFDMEGILYGNPCSGWTAPKWVQPGDLVFFMMTRTSAQTVKSLAKEWPEARGFYALDEANLITQMLVKAQWLADTYSGKVFAIGLVDSEAELALPIADNPHFNRRLFADVVKIESLARPVDMEEFKAFVSISRTGSITSVPEDQLARFKDVLTACGNSLPDYAV